MLLTREERATVGKAILEAEEGTDLQLRFQEGPGRRYLWVHLVGALLGWVLGTLGMGVYAWLYAWAPTAVDLLFGPAWIACCGSLLPLVPHVKRFLIPSTVLERRAARAAEASFFREGLQQVKDQMGVLIYVSRSERRVLFLAGEGVRSRLEAGPCQVMMLHLKDSLKQKHFSRDLVSVILEVGSHLRGEIPKRVEPAAEPVAGEKAA